MPLCMDARDVRDMRDVRDVRDVNETNMKLCPKWCLNLVANVGGGGMRKREKVGLCGGEFDVMNVDDKIRTHRTTYYEHVLAADCCHSVVYSTACALHVYNTFCTVCPQPPSTVLVPTPFGGIRRTKSTGKYYLLFLAAPPNTKIHKENDFLSAF